jgi:hypothetical protein
MTSNLYVIYRSDEIRHSNKLMTSTLEFWKIKLKTYNVLDEIKKQEDGTCDLNQVSELWDVKLYVYVCKHSGEQW